MKQLLFASTLVTILAVAFALPNASPAGTPKKGQKSSSAKKSSPPPQPVTTQPAPASSPALNPNFMAPAARLPYGISAMATRQPTAAQIADQDVCLFQNANFTGWKFCTNVKNFQVLPTPYQRQLTSIKIPDGFLLKFYRNPDRSGGTCVFYGQVGQVAPDCDNIASSISYEPDPEWPAKLAEAQRQRDMQEAEDSRQAMQRNREAAAAVTASLTVPEQNLADRFCFFRELFLRGARLCSSLTSLQQIPPEFARKIKSIRIPEGYRLQLFRDVSGNGSNCVFYGEVSQIGDGCGNMARAYFYEVDPEVSQAEFLAAHNRREAERATREMADARERRRADIRNAGKCAARLSTVDNDSSFLVVGRAHFAQHEHCANSAAVRDVGHLNVGTELDDNFEIVQIENPYVKFIGYRDINFTGPTVTVTCGTHELIGAPENEITSYKIEILDEAVSCNSDAIKKWD